MKEQIRKHLVLFLILLFAPLMYVVLSKGKHNFIDLPIYGPRELAENGDTLYHSLAEFQFLDQDSNLFSSTLSDQKVLVINFFFTTCKTICIPMNQEVYRTYYQFKDRDDIQFCSFTVDPEADQPSVLKAYAEQFDVEGEKWKFLTGEKSELYTLAQKQCFLSAIEDTTLPDFIHDDRIVLIDKQRRIRGFYTATDKEEVDRLIDEIKVLKAIEQIPKKK